MSPFVVLIIGLAAAKFAQFMVALLVDIIATMIAAWYCWRSNRLIRRLQAVKTPCNAIDLMPAWVVSRAHRRLMTRHLRLSVAMTAHFNLFPRSSARGYALARRFTTGMF